MKYLIHVEKIWDEKVWVNLVEFIKTHKCHLFLMSPQFEYQKNVLGYCGTKRELEKMLKKRYLGLKKLQEVFQFKVGLHLHVSLFPGEMRDNLKKDLFHNSIYFLEDIFNFIDGVTFGWFKYDVYLKTLCSNSQFPILHKGISFHDYDFPVGNLKLFEFWLRDKLRGAKLFLS